MCRHPLKTKPKQKCCSESLQRVGQLFKGNKRDYALLREKTLFFPVSLPAEAVAKFADLLGASAKRPQFSR